MKDALFAVSGRVIQMRWLTALVAAYYVTFGFAYDDEFVTCGSVLKLSNVNEGSRLHSHDVKYGSGSGQQSVTAVTASDDHSKRSAIEEIQSNAATRFALNISPPDAFYTPIISKRLYLSII
ncbi:hypothetical protein OSTOST_15770, partial [Ostertagia ostertagi]